MTINGRFHPVTGNALSLMRGRRLSLENAAVRVDEIHHAEIRSFPPIKMFDQDRDLITKTAFTSPWDVEMDKVAGAQRSFPASHRYVLRNVLATPHGFYTVGGGFERSGDLKFADLLASRIPIIDRGFYAPSRLGIRFFAHWIMDGMAMAELRQKDEALYFAAPNGWKHAQDYLAQLHPGRLKDRYVFFREMAYCPDRSHTTARHARFRKVRDRVQTALAPAEHAGVMIKRGASGEHRLLKNEEALAQRLVDRGYRICAATDDLETIFAACGGARVVVSLEGSQWAHALYTAAWGARHVIINPADRFYGMIAAYAAAAGGRMGTVVASADGGGYLIDIDRALRMVDWAERAED